jgi:hypothetical protein
MNEVSIIKRVGKALSIAGAMWALPSSIPVIAASYVLIHAQGYAPSDFVVSEVVFSRGSGEDGGTFHARGTVNGAQEDLPLYELAGVGTGWLSTFTDSGRYPQTADEAERYAKPGQVIRVQYNSQAPNMGIGGENLRVLLHHDDFPATYRHRLLRRDLPVCVGPLLVGLSFLGVAGSARKTKARIQMRTNRCS